MSLNLNKDKVIYILALIISGVVIAIIIAALKSIVNLPPEIEQWLKM